MCKIGLIFEQAFLCNTNGMKKILILLIFFLPNGLIFAQADISDNISLAFKTGNTGEIVKYFETGIDLSIPGSEGIYSKSQSELILKNFFTSHSPQSFSMLHQGNSKDGSKYMIGNLTTKGGGIQDVYLYEESVRKIFYSPASYRYWRKRVTD